MGRTWTQGSGLQVQNFNLSAMTSVGNYFKYGSNQSWFSEQVLQSDPFDKPVKGTFQIFFMIDKWIFVGQSMAWIPEHQWLSFLRLTFYQVHFISVVTLLFVVTKNCGAVSNPIISTLIIIIIIIHIDCHCSWHLAFKLNYSLVILLFGRAV